LRPLPQVMPGRRRWSDSQTNRPAEQIGAGPGLPLKTTRSRRGAARIGVNLAERCTLQLGEVRREIGGSAQGVGQALKGPASVPAPSCLSYGP